MTQTQQAGSAQADIGVIGLAVMGENLILNMESKGFTVAAFNRTTSKVTAFVEGRAKGKNVIGSLDAEDFVQSLKKPRKVMIMVKAGDAVDQTIEHVLPYLEAGDVVIDGGNSHFRDSERRTGELADKGILFVGTGVSGGEEGALHGPSIMPGGNPAAWPIIKPIFQAIAAKVADGTPCCDWVGDGGAGHFVKMVHNGIEYADMQMIAEAYALLRDTLDLTPDALADTFAAWNKTELNSYLIQITAEILHKKDDQTGQPMVDVILDAAGQKGTGKWTSETALDVGSPTATITEAVFARAMSALKAERLEAAKLLKGPDAPAKPDADTFTEQVRQALYASKIGAYAQGFQLMKLAAAEHGWKLNFGSIALMWREGCIIRAQFLDRIKDAYDAQPELANLLLAPYFAQAVEGAQRDWRQAVSAAVLGGSWVPAFSSALAYYDGYRSGVLPANLIQAQRDYFGAHTYERTDQPRGQFFHTNWTGRGGDTASSTYNA